MIFPSSQIIRVLTLNGGSSSIKFALFEPGNPSDEPKRILDGQIERIGLPDATLNVRCGTDKHAQPVAAADAPAAVHALVDWLESQKLIDSLAGVSHRIVHGGSKYWQPQRVDDELLVGLRALAQIDPAHLPGEIALIEVVTQRYPKLPQVVCFDTAFHHDLPTVAKLLPIPRSYTNAGYRKFGFHGLSYQYLIKQLAKVAGEVAASGRVILAHLGSGASLAAVKNGKSIDTTMSYTPTAGLVMGTRSGDLDPGVLVALMRTEHKSADEIDALINKQSGLKGISETSSDTRDLLAQRGSDPRANEAIEIFCYQARKHIGAMAAALGGVDTLIFSGGIGEHQAEVRAEICADLNFLGIDLDPAANAVNAPVISRAGAAATVRVIPTDEESTLAEAAFNVLRQTKANAEPPRAPR